MFASDQEAGFVTDDFITEGDVVEGAQRPHTTEPERPQPPPPAASAAPPWLAMLRRFWLPGLLVLALAATGTFTWLWRSADASNSDRAALTAAGAGFTRAFLTLDSAHIDRTEAAVLKLSTGAFQRVYKQGLEAGVLSAVLSVAHATTTARVPDVYVGSANSRSANVITHALVTVVAFDKSGKALPARSVEFYVQLDLVKQGGRWLVDGVENLNFGAPAQPAASPTP